eukprot:6581954-Prymnesium_polylepis.1
MDVDRARDERRGDGELPRAARNGRLLRAARHQLRRAVRVRECREGKLCPDCGGGARQDVVGADVRPHVERRDGELKLVERHVELGVGPALVAIHCRRGQRERRTRGLEVGVDGGRAVEWCDKQDGRRRGRRDDPREAPALALGHVGCEGYAVLEQCRRRRRRWRARRVGGAAARRRDRESGVCGADHADDVSAARAEARLAWRE